MAVLFPPVEDFPKRIMLKHLRYKSSNKTLIVFDLLPQLIQVMLFRFIMYMRLKGLRRLYAFVYYFVTLSYALLNFFSMLLFMWDIVYMET